MIMKSTVSKLTPLSPVLLESGIVVPFLVKKRSHMKLHAFVRYI